jgi:hypothetical protein
MVSPHVREPDWERIFSEPVVEACWVDAGYDNANDVWQVRTTKGAFVVKVGRLHTHRREDPFWHGLQTLFGLEVQDDIRRLKLLSKMINRYSHLAIPAVRTIDNTCSAIDRPYVIVERLQGAPADLEDEDYTKTIARQLGEHLAGLHRARFDYWGVYEGHPRFPREEWPERLAGAMAELIKTSEGDDAAREQLPEFQERARRLSPPEHLSLVFPDLRPSQFLQHHGELVALVDIESMVVGPRELDLVAVEYSLQPVHVGPFVAGYEKHLPMPNLSEVRGVYRFAYYLIQILGETDFERWMSHDIRFTDKGEGEGASIANREAA